MKKYDVIIIGCGPAGVSAAKRLKDNNINFCIIDKNKFPREKLCGGGLTNKSIKLLKKLNFSLKGIDTSECNIVNLNTKNISKDIKLDNNIIMVDRYEFDYNNIKQLGKINLFEEENITSINNNILITNKDKYEFKYIIFADGINGYSRKLIKNRKFGFCVEYESDKLTNKNVLDFSALIGGYGWIFAKKKHTTIGVGGMYPKKDNYVDLLIKFGGKFDFKIEKSKIRGYHIPIFSKYVYKNSVIDNKYILVGDAASLVDQVSGEGIYYALYSGNAAALSIIERLNNKNSNLKEVYFNKTNKLYKSLIKRSRVNKLLYSWYGNFLIKITLNNKKYMHKINRVFG